MFESESRGSYSFRSASWKTRKDASSVGHSLMTSSAGHSVTDSIVAGNDLGSKVILKSRTTASVAVPDRTSSEKSVQSGRSSSLALHSNGASRRSVTDTAKQSAEVCKMEHSSSSPPFKTTEDSFSHAERPETRCNSYDDTTTESCTKSGQQQQGNTPGDLGWSRSSGQWSAEDWPSSEGGEQSLSKAERHSMKSDEDNNATEIIINNNNALKDNTVATTSSPDGQSIARGQGKVGHSPSINGVALAASDDSDDDGDVGGRDDDVIPLRGQDSDLTTYQSSGQSSCLANHYPGDHSAAKSSDNLDDHPADHLHDQSAYQLDDHSADHSDDQCTDHSTDHLDGHLADHSADHSADLSSVQTENELSHHVTDNESTYEPKTSASDPTIIRTFEPSGNDATAAEAEHPYFARIAAESSEPKPILSHRGTVRGVKNRVRIGVASFLDKQDAKKTVNYAQLEKGKVVFYTTSMTVVRGTFEKCLQVKRILQTQMVEYEERDVFVSKAVHQELTERLQQQPEAVLEVPQVFVDGYHLGGAEEMERLNESGILRKIFNNFKKVLHPKCCTSCGGYRYVPCTLCHGSKKTRRNCFTNEFSALRCTSCDDNGLVKCRQCNVITSDSDQPVMASTCF